MSETVQIQLDELLRMERLKDTPARRAQMQQIRRDLDASSTPKRQAQFRAALKLVDDLRERNKVSAVRAVRER